MNKNHCVEIIGVGTELLLGGIANTDAKDISEMLTQLGINVFYHTVVGDNPARLRSVMDIAMKRADIIIAVRSNEFYGRGIIHCRQSLLSTTNAPITPGTQPQQVSNSTMRNEPHPRSMAESGGKKIAKITLIIDIFLFFIC